MVASNASAEDLAVKVHELESEVAELKSHVGDLTRLSKTHSKYSVLAMGHVLEGISIIRYYANEKNVRIEDIEGAFESIGELQCIYELCNFLDIRDEIGNYVANLMSCTLELCGKAKISSRELLAALKERFDRATLLGIINFDDVADSYGIAEATMWHQIL